MLNDTETKGSPEPASMREVVGYWRYIFRLAAEEWWCATQSHAPIEIIGVLVAVMVGGMTKEWLLTVQLLLGLALVWFLLVLARAPAKLAKAAQERTEKIVWQNKRLVEDLTQASPDAQSLLVKKLQTTTIKISDIYAESAASLLARCFPDLLDGHTATGIVSDIMDHDLGLYASPGKPISDDAPVVSVEEEDECERQVEHLLCELELHGVLRREQKYLALAGRRGRISYTAHVLTDEGRELILQLRFLPASNPFETPGDDGTSRKRFIQNGPAKHRGRRPRSD